MSAILALPPPRAQGGRAGATAIKVAYGVLSAMLVAYLIFLLVRGSGEDSPLVDDWMVAFFEVVASGLCIGRVIVGRRGWEVPVLLGASALAWAVGDLLLAAGGADAPTPSVADVFFLV